MMETMNPMRPYLGTLVGVKDLATDIRPQVPSHFGRKVPLTLTPSGGYNSRRDRLPSGDAEVRGIVYGHYYEKTHCGKSDTLAFQSS